MEERDIGKETDAATEALPEQAHFAVHANPTEVRTGPTWRGWAISVLAAVILSLAATAILGGSFAARPPTAAPAGGPCCPAAGK